jgi:hypothetical protein
MLFAILEAAQDVSRPITPYSMWASSLQYTTFTIAALCGKMTLEPWASEILPIDILSPSTLIAAVVITAAVALPVHCLR